VINIPPPMFGREFSRLLWVLGGGVGLEPAKPNDKALQVKNCDIK